MMKFTKVLLLVAVVCSITGSAVALTNGTAFNTFIASLINTFRQLPKEKSNGSVQFAVLVLLTQEEIQQWNATFQPPITLPRPNIPKSNTIIPEDPAQYVNYLAARPNFSCNSPTGRHCESQMLSHLDELYNAFTNRSNYTAAAIVLYTHFIPCINCTQAIRDSLQRCPYSNLSRTVVFSEGTGTNNLDLDYTQRVFADNNIRLHQYRDCGSSSSSGKRAVSDECTVTLSFQSFVIDCLGDSTAVSFTSAKGAVRDLVNRVMAQCKDQLNNLEACSRTALDDLIGPAQGLTKKSTFIAEYAQCVRQAVEPNRLDLLFAAKPNSLETPIGAPADLQDYTPERYSCKEDRLTGVFCTHSYASSNLTAGNTLCRGDSPCGYHGYACSWCYTDYRNNWEYCCKEPCDYHGKTYQWCYTGSRCWEYCGKYPLGEGLRDVRQRPCLTNHPCGKHGAYSRDYWCYTDARKNWGYCCSPESSCGYHGRTYKWCYTGDDKYNWQRCKG